MSFLTRLNFFNFLIFFDLLFGTFLFLENHRLVYSLKDSIVYFSMYFFVCSLGVNETYFSIPFLYCQYFFKNILKIFFVSFLRQNKKLVVGVFTIVLLLLFTNFLCIIFWYFCLLLGTFIILTPLSKNVNTFFEFFLKIFNFF